MRGHIITCETYSDYQAFLAGGYAGLYPQDCRNSQGVQPTVGKMQARLKVNWDIIADLKRVKPSDYIFLHTERMIYGPFRATTYFRESPTMPSLFRSVNLNLSHWRNQYAGPVNFPQPLPWRVGIEHVSGVTMQDGVSSMELFKLTSVGLIQSVPQRFQYHDMPKIVKPLLSHEVEALLDLLQNSGSGTHLTVAPANLSTWPEITVDLNTRNGEFAYEKILEAWLMENITNNGSNTQAFQQVCNAIGSATHFANSIFTYYTNFLDVILYNERTGPLAETCANCGKFTSKNKTDIRVIELKKGRVASNDIYQVNEYANWATRALADGKSSEVTPYLIGTGFTRKLLRQSEVKCVKYEISGSPPAVSVTLLN